MPNTWCEIGPPHLPLSCRSLSSETHFELNSNGTAKSFHSFRHRSHSSPKNRSVEHCKAEETFGFETGLDAAKRELYDNEVANGCSETWLTALHVQNQRFQNVTLRGDGGAPWPMGRGIPRFLEQLH
jgi:hypothetical protein